MYHSITIGTKNTWDDWHLIPDSRPLVNPPQVKTNIVDIPGGDGSLDLTYVLTGRPTFKNRTGSWTFYVENGFREWHELYSEIMAYLHGKTYKVILEDDPAYYYEGRLSVNNWKSDQQWSQITIDYDLKPYKWEDESVTGSNWLWDPFNFETDVIRDYKNLTVNGTLSVIIYDIPMPMNPIIISENSYVSVTFGEETYRLAQGANMMEEILLQPGENELVFTGNGRVTIENVGGRL